MSAPIIPKLPDRFDVNEGIDIPGDLIGATIIKFGSPRDRELADCILVIEYQPRDSSEIRRVELGFNERAMWVEQPIQDDESGDAP